MTNLSVASRVVGLAVVVVAGVVPGLNTASGTSLVVGLRVVVLVVVAPEFGTAARRCGGGVAFGTKTGAGGLVVNSAPREPCELASLLLGKSGPGCLVVKSANWNANRGKNVSLCVVNGRWVVRSLRVDGRGVEALSFGRS